MHRSVQIKATDLLFRRPCNVFGTILQLILSMIRFLKIDIFWIDLKKLTFNKLEYCVLQGLWSWSKIASSEFFLQRSLFFGPSSFDVLKWQCHERSERGRIQGVANWIFATPSEKTSFFYSIRLDDIRFKSSDLESSLTALESFFKCWQCYQLRFL